MPVNVEDKPVPYPYLSLLLYTKQNKKVNTLWQKNKKRRKNHEKSEKSRL